MDKKVLTAIIAVIVVAGAAVGGYFAFHKSSPSTTSNYTTAPSTTKSANTAPAPATSVNNAVLTTKTKSGIGKYLADPSGKTLYTFSGDSQNTSNCTASCIANWPAYQDTGATTGLPTNVATIKRTDNGQTQFTYKGKPLYYFASDSSAGQVTGNGIEGFSVAKP